MKTIIQYLLTAVLLFAFADPVSAKETPVKSKITHVTVFLQGAQITRKGSATLTEGRQTLVFRSLSSEIRPGSIRVEGKGKFTLLSVKYRNNYLDPRNNNPEYQALKKKLDALTGSREALTVEMQVLKGEESMLDENKTVSGQNGLNVTTLSGVLAYYQKKMTEIKTRETEINRQLQELDKKIKQVKLQMEELTKKQKMSTGEVVVTVTADAPEKASFVVRYYTPQARWRPEYDVRVEDVTKEVKIGYKAFIKQTTGETWDRVPVTLSTGNPAAGGNKPELYPWYLDFRQEKETRYSVMSKSMAVMNEKAAPVARTTADYTNVTLAQTTTEFNITLPWTLPSEEREEAVMIRNISLPAKYAYYAVPKINRDVFLTAAVAGWKKYDFLSGKMNLFLEGSFTGTAYLDVSRARDTLLLTLGRDKRIKVERKKIQDFTQKQTLGNNIRETHGWQISVMNTKKVPVHLIIEDQIPVSKRKEITVEPLELSGAHLNKTTGKCMWDVTLQPEESRSFILKFSVKYPKNQSVYVD